MERYPTWPFIMLKSHPGWHFQHFVQFREGYRALYRVLSDRKAPWGTLYRVLLSTGRAPREFFQLKGPLSSDVSITFLVPVKSSIPVLLCFMHVVFHSIASVLHCKCFQIDIFLICQWSVSLNMFSCVAELSQSLYYPSFPSIFFSDLPPLLSLYLILNPPQSVTCRWLSDDFLCRGKRMYALMLSDLRFHTVVTNYTS